MFDIGAIDQDLLEERPMTTIERCHSIFVASQTNRVPRDLLNIIVLTEGGDKGSVRLNSNGSWDMGPAQVNTLHKDLILSHYPDITWQQFSTDVFANIDISAKIFRQCINDPAIGNSGWDAVGCYNSRTINIKTNYLFRAMSTYDRVQQDKSGVLACSNYW
ncbi:lytic transglycosylase domain-containing protein [Enterovibrio norvegicus]|uniref:lytic transglycosylase domain-containing protein n=1 Tax=Enterovibrio norvegicus TaxID=188144 RepID=UPI00352FE9E7